MSGSFRRIRPPESWQPGQDYWVFVPSVPDILPLRRSLNSGDLARDPQWFVEDTMFRRPDPFLASLPPTEPLRTRVPFQVHDNYERYPRTQNLLPGTSPTTYYEPRYVPSRIEESKLSQEDQTKALNKLRKQLYNPHLSSIIRRLGTKSSTNKEAKGSFVQDEDGKRCAICLEDFDTKQFVTLTPCNHMFHEECIVPWVKSEGKCPVCRFVIAERNASPPRNNTTSGRIQRDLISVIRAHN